MAAHDFLRRVEIARRDLGALLFHWTRRTEHLSALEVLFQILQDEALIGSSKYMVGSVKCVCFTEAPITEAAALFRVMESEPPPPRYEPYGIAVRKRWLFERGGRPVIYQPLNDAQMLPQDLRWRHMSYDPTQGPDFTWEREWRICKDRLPLTRRECLVVVRTAEEAFDVMTHAASGTEGPEWLTTPMSFFGLTGGA
jgi:hypothetical protein